MSANTKEMSVLHEEVQHNSEICCNSKTNKNEPYYRLATLELDSGGLVASQLAHLTSDQAVQA